MRMAFLVLLFVLPALAAPPEPFCEKEFAPLGDSKQDSIKSSIQQGLVRAQESGGPQVPANVFAGNPLAERYYSFAARKQLLSQNDTSLNRFDLIVANGGLCATTCVGNLLGVLVGEGEIQKDLPALVAGLVLLYKRIIEETIKTGMDYLKVQNPALYQASLSDIKRLTDARRGAYLEPLTRRVRPIVENSGGKIGEVTIAMEENLGKVRNGILVAAVKVTDEKQLPILGANEGHAINILKVDTVNQIVYVSDPKRANDIYARKYWIGPGGRPQFQSLVSEVPNGPTYFELNYYQLIEK